MTGLFGDTLAVLSALAATWKLAISGHISWPSLGLVAGCFVAVRLAGRIVGGRFSHYVRLSCRIGLPMVSLVVLLATARGTKEYEPILVSYVLFWLVFAIAMVWYRHMLWSLLGLSAVFLWLNGLVARGYLSEDRAYVTWFVFLVATVYMHFTGSKPVQAVNKGGLAFAGVMIAAGVLAGGSYVAAGQAATVLAALILATVGLMMMLRGVSGG